MARCKSCNASIIWLPSAAGDKPMPLDEAPHAEGNVVIRGTPPTAVVLGKNELAQVPLVPELRYRAHFVTCPQASKWRAPFERKAAPRG